MFYDILDVSIGEDAPQFELSTLIKKEKNEEKIPDFEVSRIHELTSQYQAYDYQRDLYNFLSVNAFSLADIKDIEWLSKD